MQAQRRLSVDHILLTVSPQAPEVDVLEAAGFAEGPPNVHPGQGSACRRFFFDNAYLEFAWLENEADATASGIQRTGLLTRLKSGTAASHIGICIRLAATLPPPVETWPYRPPYLPAGSSIPVAVNSTRLDEPLLFFLPSELARPATGVTHRNRAGRISRVQAQIVGDREPSPELGWLAASGLVSVGYGQSESLTIEFDQGRQGERIALDTESPLVLQW